MIIKTFLYKTTAQNKKPTSGFSSSIQQLHIITIGTLYDRAEEISFCITAAHALAEGLTCCQQKQKAQGK